MKLKPIPALSEGMKSLANFINENRVPRVIDISKNAKRFTAFIDEDYINQPLKTEFISLI